MVRIWRWLKDKVVAIAKLDSTPPKVAGSVALGAFIGMVPLIGLQTWIALLLSFILRVNKIGTILSVQLLCNPISLPFICYLDLRVGELLLGYSDPPIGWRNFKSLDWSTMMQLTKPLFLGSLAMGTLLACLVYPLSLFFIKRFRRRLEK